MNHNSRCPNCKTTIYLMLYEVFGNIIQKYKVENISTNVENYSGTNFYKILKNIYTTLVEYRNFHNFINSPFLQRCDVFVENYKVIIELDEVQHFTYPRLLTLENYTDSIETGYDRNQYINLCKISNSKDNDPEFRDEQRAWYDTIRDFLPLLSEDIKKPTIRIPLGQFKWCDLDTKNTKDQKLFKEMISLS